MTPLLGTKTSSKPIGAAPGGDNKTARAAAAKVFHGTRDTGLPGAPRKPARIPRFSRNTRHETRITAFFRNTAFMLFMNHSFPTHDFPPFPTISRHFPAFPGPPHPPLRRSSVHAPSAFLGQPPGTAAPARLLLSCALWRGMGRLWRGMGGMAHPEPLSAHRPHRQQGLSGFHETRITNYGYCQARGAGCPLGRREFRGFHESRDTKHESRPFPCVLRPSGGEICRLLYAKE